MRKNNELNFNGQTIYIGLDVHKKNWKVGVVLKHSIFKPFSQPPQPEALYKYLNKHFPGGTYKSVYEAGYCGFWIHDKLLKLGIDNIVVNPADVPTSDKDKKRKNDKRDALKLAKGLRSGQLEAIYTPCREFLERRSFVRLRDQQVKDLVRTKSRIKHHLLFMGFEIPEKFDNQCWSKNFIRWIASISTQTTTGKFTLDGYLNQFESQRKLLLQTNRQLRDLSRTPQYAKQVELLRSVPGIGIVATMKILTELGDIRRFNSFKQLRAFVGFIPNTDSSGENERVGNMTSRGSKQLRKILIEASWVSIRHDSILALKYQKLKSRMKGQKAIVRIACKLLSRIRFVLINEVKYEIGKVK